MKFYELYESIINEAINQKLIDKAIHYFGLTDNPNETGYVLPDGRRLDFSGRHQINDYVFNDKTLKFEIKNKKERDYMFNERNIDHREVQDIINSSDTRAMIDFMKKTSAIRYLSNSGITVIENPTDQQLKVIISDFRKSQEILEVDVTDFKTMNTIDSKEFPRATLEAVKNYIEDTLKNKGKKK